MKQLKRSLAAILAIAMVLTTLGMSVVSAANTYSDVSGHWAESYIQTWSNKSVINGYDDGTFRPDANISRAEVAKIIVSAKNATALSSTTFTDVPSDAWYALYVSRAVQAGYVTGDTEGTFRPEDPITREEASAIMARAYGLTGSGDANFSDSASISDWALSSVQALVAAGAINGYEDGTFRPQAYITRAELVKILDLAYTAANTNNNGSSIIGGGNGGNGGNGGSIGGGNASYYSVKFVANGGSIDGKTSTTERVRRNATLANVAPVAVRAGYDFVDWYRSESAANSLNDNYVWDLSSDRVTSGITLYAGWRASNELTVTFDYGNGTVDTETVMTGEKVSKPTEKAERAGFTFTNKWYTDPECTKEYNFGSSVTEDMVLYAGWEVNEETEEETIVTVAAEANEKAEISVYPQKVLVGEDVTVRITPDEGSQVSTAVVNYTDTTGVEKSISLTVDKSGKASFEVPADVDVTKGMTVVVTTEDAPEATATAAPTATATSTNDPSEPTASAEPTATTEPTAEPTQAPEPELLLEDVFDASRADSLDKNMESLEFTGGNGGTATLYVVQPENADAVAWGITKNTSGNAYKDSMIMTYNPGGEVTDFELMFLSNKKNNWTEENMSTNFDGAVTVEVLVGDQWQNVEYAVTEKTILEQATDWLHHKVEPTGALPAGATKIRVTIVANKKYWNASMESAKFYGYKEDVQPTAAPTATVAPTSAPTATATADPSVVTAKDEAELLAALANTEAKTINLSASFTVSAPVNVTRGVTINGQGNTITAAEGQKSAVVVGPTTEAVVIENLNAAIAGAAPADWNASYAIQVYAASNVTLRDVKASNGNAGILVNGSTVKLEGVVDVSDNTFGGIEVSKGEGVESEPVLSGTAANLKNTSESASKPTIWTDGVADTAVTVTDLHKAEMAEKNQTYFFLNEANLPSQPTATAAPTATAEPTATVEPTAAPTATAPISSGEAEKYVYGNMEANAIFDGTHMVEWSPSKLDGDSANPMFEVREVGTVDGSTVKALTRKVGNKNNAAGYVTYKVEEITSAEITFIYGKKSGKIPVHSVVEASADNKEWTPLEGVNNGAFPTDDGSFARMVYNFTNIPEGTQYIKINFAMPTSADAAGYNGVSLESAKFNKDASLGDAPANLSVSAPDANSLSVSWDKIETDEDVSYVVALDGYQKAVVSKDITSYSISDVEASTEYRVSVYAIVRNEEGADRTTGTAKSEIVKTAAAANQFVDKFKFSETIDTPEDNKTISHEVVWDANLQTIQRKVFEDELTVVYELDENIDSFAVTMLAYREKTNVPGDTTFQVSTDGSTDWTDVTATREGTDFGTSENWVTKTWVYNASNVQTTLPGAKYLKVIFGDPCMKSDNKTKIPESVRLQKVVVNTAQENPAPEGKTEYVKIDFTGATISEADSEQKKTVTAQNLISSGTDVTIETQGNYDQKSETYKNNRFELRDDEVNGKYLTPADRKVANNFLFTLGEAVTSDNGKVVFELDTKRVNPTLDDPVSIAVADSNQKVIFSIQFKQNTPMILESVTPNVNSDLACTGDFVKLKAEIDFTAKTYKLFYSTDGGSSFKPFSGTDTTYEFKDKTAENLMYIGNKDIAGAQTKGSVGVDNLYIYTI